MSFPFGVVGGIGSLGWRWCGGSVVGGRWLFGWGSRGGFGAGACARGVLVSWGLCVVVVYFGWVCVPVAWVGRRGLYVSH